MNYKFWTVVVSIGAFFFGYYIFGSFALSLGAVPEFAYPFGVVIGAILAYVFYTSASK